MQVPGWLLKLLIAFLSNRELIVRHKKTQSKKKMLPGGSPQGTRLGMLLFLILINLAGFSQDELVKNVGEVITQPFKLRKPMDKIHLKYIDDLTLGTRLDLKRTLIKDPNPTPIRPLTYHNRTGHILRQCDNVMQTELDKLVRYSEDHFMKINYKKTKCMLFNPLKQVDLMPNLLSPCGQPIELVEQFRLLGIEIRSDLRWNANTDSICTKFYNRLWIIRNLKELGTNQTEIVDIYVKQVRVMAELAVPVWEPGLTMSQSNQIERCQMVACVIILGQNYQSYRKSLNTLGLKSLKVRRSEICRKFAKKSVNHIKFKHWFSQNTNEQHYNTRYEKPVLKPVPARKKKYERSPLPFLTDMLNNTIKAFDETKSEFTFL